MPQPRSTPEPRAPSTPIARLTPIGRAGRYEILGRLSEGGMANIFLARVRSSAGVERIVVVKHLLPEADKRSDATRTLILEAKLLSRISHPNVVAIEELGEHAGRHYLAMEWVRGVSLRKLLIAAKAQGGLPWPIAARIFSQLAAALHYVHVAKDGEGRALNIVHRDVTPENVIVSSSGAPKLLDFGIAKSAIDPQKTQAGLLKGKFQYIAPEQYEGKTPDARSDVFSLAVTMYEALTSESLYARANEFETVAAIVLDPNVPSIRDRRPDVPVAFENVVREGLAKDRKLRTASADAISVALDGLLVAEGQQVREADVAAYLGKLFGGELEREPELDRTSPFGRESDRPKNDLENQLLRAEAELDSEAYEHAARSRQRTAIAFILVALVCASAVLAWAITSAP